VGKWVRIFVIAGVVASIAACGKGGGGGSVGGVGDASVNPIIPPAPPPSNTMSTKYIVDQQGGIGNKNTSASFGLAKTAVGGNRFKGSTASPSFKIQGTVTVGW
jgi:hypothetical protein